MVYSKNTSNPTSTVMVVNDDITQLNILCRLLKKMALEPVPFTDAETALVAMAQAAPPALMITDLYMPGIDGWRFCRLLRSPEYAQFNQVPLLVVSATFSGDETSRITSELGANAFLSMPVEAEQFSAFVQALLKGEKPPDFLNVLIVEDDKLTSQRLQKAFQAHSYRAYTAATVQEALGLLAQGTFAVAVLDYHLPDGQGDDLLKKLEEKSPACVRIMITADARPELALAWMKQGAAAYLRKPFEPEYLITLCEKACRERTLLRVQDLLEVRTHQLRESEERFRNAMDATSDGLWDWDVPSGKVYYSPAYFHMLGYTPNELPASVDTWLELLHPDDRPVALAANLACMRHETETIHVEFRMRHRDSTWRWILGRGHALRRDESGQALQMIGTHADITGRKQIEEAFQASEKRFRRLVESSNDMIFSMNRTGVFLTAGGVRLHQFGLKPEDVTGRSLYDLFPPEEAKYYHQRQIEVFESGEAITYESTFSFSGLTKTDLTTVYPIKDDLGGVEAVGVICRDITERKQLEATLESRLVALTRPLDHPEGIDFKDLFGLEAIQRLQDDFSTATGVASIITLPDGTPITQPSNFCRLCKDIIRKTDQGRINCFKSDAALGRFQAEGPTIQPCMSGGLWDAGASIAAGGRHIANWLIGQVRDETQTEEKIRAYARTIGADETTVVKAFYEVPAMSQEQFQRVGQVLFTMANQLSTIAYQNIQQARFITERKQMEQALRESEERYHLIDEASQDMIYSYDRRGRFTHANSSLCKLMGLRPEQIIGKTHQELGFPPEQCAEWTRLHQQVYDSGATVIAETVTPIQGEASQYFEVVLNPIHDENDVIIGIAGTTRDINDRKQAQTKINEQLEELRRWYNVTLGREERIHELKREVNNLLFEAGKPARYESVM